MHFKELYLKSFGKFNNRKISLSPKINVIYGENESGKTTINDFITGMVFGFVKDSKKRTLYRDEHSRYIPWIGNMYSGSMTVVLDDKEYRVERDFSKGKEDLTVLDTEIGQNLTTDFVDDEGKRVLQIGQKLFGMTETMYLNTVSINQIGEYESSVAMELNDKLKNQSETNLEDLSISNSISYLDGIVTNLVKQTKPRELEKQIRELEIEYKIYFKRREEYFQLVDELSQKQKEIADVKLELDRLIAIEDKLNLMEAQSVSNEITIIEKQIDEIIKHIAELPEYTYIDEKLYLEIINLIETKRNIETEINTDLLRLKEYEKFELTEEVYDEAKFIKLEEDYNEFKSFKKEAHKDVLNKDLGLSFILMILFLLAGNFINKYLYLGILASLGLMIYLVKRSEKNSRTNPKEGILKSYGLSSNDEFERYYLDEKAKYLNRLDKLQLKDRTEAAKNSIQIELNSLDEKHLSISDRLKSILDTQGIKSLDEVNEIAELKNRYEIYELKISELENNIKLLSKDIDIENLKEYSGLELNAELDYKEELENLSEIKGIYNNLRDGIQILTGEINSREADVEKYNEIRQSGEILSNIVIDYKEKRSVVEETKDILSELSNLGNRSVLPSINSKMSDVLSLITDGKYSKILIDEEFNIKVYDSEIDAYVEVVSLSTGTIDQIYLAHKLAVLESLSDDLPIIFDDSFVNYDDIRLKNTIMSLEKISQDHQIIISTCQKRELNILSDLEIEHNTIII